MKRSILILAVLLVLAAAGLGVIWLLRRGNQTPRDQRVMDWIRNPAAHPAWAIQAGETCNNAPFQMPTRGYIGYLWDDSFYAGHRHQGIDIFGGTQPGLTPVYAAYDGYLTRLEDWKSSLILRIPDDPLQPGRQIWTYYTHLAGPDGDSLIDAQFPPGAQEVFVQAGTLLGYQGNFSGTSGQPVGVHLHFSIVLDDGQGKFRNELEFANTLDPSPYLGLELNAQNEPATEEYIPLCEKTN
ncbi:MAG TPA: M23 family metallopeptidase [Anaerolineaceae bacterium]|nr:M23 family metallopeptidase [Anaerolineaceae bacterium]